MSESGRSEPLTPREELELWRRKQVGTFQDYAVRQTAMGISHLIGEAVMQDGDFKFDAPDGEIVKEKDGHEVAEEKEGTFLKPRMFSLKEDTSAEKCWRGEHEGVGPNSGFVFKLSPILDGASVLVGVPPARICRHCRAVFVARGA